MVTVKWVGTLGRDGSVGWEEEVWIGLKWKQHPGPSVHDLQMESLCVTSSGIRDQRSWDLKVGPG